MERKLKYLWDTQEKRVERIWVEADPDARLAAPCRKPRSIREAHEKHELLKGLKSPRKRSIM